MELTRSDSPARAANAILLRHVGPPALPSLWQSLIADSGADTALVSAEGVLLWCPSWHSWWPRLMPVEQAIGRNLADLPPADASRETLAIVQRVIASGRPVLVRKAWKGVWTQTVYRRLDGPDGVPPVVLIVCRGLRLPDFEGHPILSEAESLDSTTHDHGPLAGLTQRELQVLSFIGQGLTTEQISKRMFRSRKTIEAHRQTLGTKLGVNSRVDLARVAIQCGLHIMPPTDLPQGPRPTGRSSRRGKA